MASGTLRRVEDLVAAGIVPAKRQAELNTVVERFSLAITPAMAALIEPSDPDDPIRRQFVPQRAELDVLADEMADPIDDFGHSPVKGLVHRYPDRVLFKPLLTCPVYCRFCFRREQVGAGSDSLNEPELAAAYDYISQRPEIWEVVVSGGDPWLLSPRRIRNLMRELEAISHIAVVRFHTRVPVVDPARVTDALIASLASTKSVWVVLHVNHPREITDHARDACRMLRLAGIPMLSQSVLLKGVNDDAAVLTTLFRSLVAMGVKPYYLHHGDLAEGTSHFRTSIQTGQELMRRLRGRVSGLCQPTYMLDIPNAHGKVPIERSYATPTPGAETWEVEDIHGNVHSYPPASKENG